MVGPSARGSEKGTPNSRMSAPRAAISRARARVVARSGSPAVIKGIRAFSPLALSCLNTLSMRLTGHLHSFGHCVHVLVTPAGEVDDNDVIGGVFGRPSLQVGGGGGGPPGVGEGWWVGPPWPAASTPTNRTGSSRKALNSPMALLPPPTQATRHWGSLPVRRRNWARASRPITAWKSR